MPFAGLSPCVLGPKIGPLRWEPEPEGRPELQLPAGQRLPGDAQRLDAHEALRQGLLEEQQRRGLCHGSGAWSLEASTPGASCRL